MAINLAGFLVLVDSVRARPLTPVTPEHYGDCGVIAAGVATRAQAIRLADEWLLKNKTGGAGKAAARDVLVIATDAWKVTYFATLNIWIGISADYASRTDPLPTLKDYLAALEAAPEEVGAGMQHEQS